MTENVGADGFNISSLDRMLPEHEHFQRPLFRDTASRDSLLRESKLSRIFLVHSPIGFAVLTVELEEFHGKIRMELRRCLPLHAMHRNNCSFEFAFVCVFSMRPFRCSVDRTLAKLTV